MDLEEPELGLRGSEVGCMKVKMAFQGVWALFQLRADWVRRDTEPRGVRGAGVEWGVGDTF